MPLDRLPMPPNDAAPVIDQMQALLWDTIAPLCAGRERYALLDFPGHPNVGDSAIYGGELILLDDLFGHPAEYVCDLYSHTGDVDRSIGDGVIFLHGGGNFGDVWPRHQILRQEILARYPNNRIVQLPQSLHFNDPKACAPTARAIAAHRDFTLLVRDRPSLDFARAHFDCETLLCPDCAFMIGPSRGAVPVRHDVLAIFRSDHERIEDPDKAAFFEVGPVTDWLQETSPVRVTDRVVGRLLCDVASLRPKLMATKERSYRRQAWIRIRRGLDLLGTGGIIVTDRLHAHILSVLLGKRHIVVDNFYSKIQRYIGAWPEEGLTYRAKTFADARRILDELTG
jgi:exopolysaccharide biosynthesis predicted pyruvyltransferase EpsI